MHDLNKKAVKYGVYNLKEYLYWKWDGCIYLQNICTKYD